jgi:transcriptional regulator with XRE-family HTH domain
MSTQSNPDEPVAARLRELLKKRRVTGKALALSIEVSENTVSSWATGTHRPRKRHAEALAHELNAPIAEFFDMPETGMAAKSPGEAAVQGTTPRTADEIISRLAALNTRPPSASLSALAHELESVLDDAQEYVASRRVESEA